MNVTPFMQLSCKDICALACSGFALQSAEPGEQNNCWLLTFAADSGVVKTFSLSVSPDKDSLMSNLSGLDPVQVALKIWKNKHQ